MRGNRSRCKGVIALAAMVLWARGPIRAQDADAGADAGADADAETLHPPHLLDAPPPAYPMGRESEGLHPTVVLRITVTAQGEVTDIVVEHSAGADFDAEAVRAVMRWTFDPATRGDTPVASRVRVAVHFEPPSAGVPHEGETHEPQEAPHIAPTTPPPNVPAEVRLISSLTEHLID